MKAWQLVFLLLLLPGCHWCPDETNIFILSVTGGGGIVAWGRAKWHHFKVHRNCRKSPSLPGGK